MCLRDITDRREAERELRESELRYRMLVDHAPEAILVFDVDAGCYVDANPNAERLFGFERATLLKRNPLDLSPEFAAQRGTVGGPDRTEDRRASWPVRCWCSSGWCALRTACSWTAKCACRWCPRAPGAWSGSASPIFPIASAASDAPRPSARCSIASPPARRCRRCWRRSPS